MKILKPLHIDFKSIKYTKHLINIEIYMRYAVMWPQKKQAEAKVPDKIYGILAKNANWSIHLIFKYYWNCNLILAVGNKFTTAFFFHLNYVQNIFLHVDRWKLFNSWSSLVLDYTFSSQFVFFSLSKKAF